MSNPWDKPLSPSAQKKLRDNVIFKPQGSGSGSGSGGDSGNDGKPGCPLIALSFLAWLARHL